VNNNPLAFNDPSGYFLSSIFKALKKLFKAIVKTIVKIIKKVIKVIKKVVKFIKENLRVVLAVVVAVAVAVYAPQLLISNFSWASTTVAGATQTGVALSLAGKVAVGAIAGGLSSLVATGSLSAAFKGAVFGGITAGLAHGFVNGNALAKTFKGVKRVAQATTHGLIGGIRSKLNGGSFSKGFLSAAVAKGLTPSAVEAFQNSGVFLQGIAVATVGGLASSLAGGSFEQGFFAAGVAFAVNRTLSERPKRRPKFKDLSKGFPGKKNISQVGRLVGGKVEYNIEKGHFENACAIRVCVALNEAGETIPFIEGETSSGQNGTWHIFRVDILRDHLNETYGEAEVSSTTNISDFVGKQGIIIFEKQYDNATGHADLWNGVDCLGNCAFEGAVNVELWQLE